MLQVGRGMSCRVKEITNSWAPSSQGMGLAGSIHVDTNALIAVIPKKTRRSDSDSAAPRPLSRATYY